MDIKLLHSHYKDEHSPTVEGQIRWLQNQGFSQDQIDQAMIATYFDIERGCIPCKWERRFKDEQGRNTNELIFLPGDQPKPGDDWSGGPVAGGKMLDQYLLKVAKDIRTKELADKTQALGAMVSKMKAQWEADAKKAASKPGIIKRMFGKKAEA